MKSLITGILLITATTIILNGFYYNIVVPSVQLHQAIKNK